MQWSRIGRQVTVTQQDLDGPALEHCRPRMAAGYPPWWRPGCDYCGCLTSGCPTKYIVGE